MPPLCVHAFPLCLCEHVLPCLLPYCPAAYCLNNSPTTHTFIPCPAWLLCWEVCRHRLHAHPHSALVLICLVTTLLLVTLALMGSTPAQPCFLPTLITLPAATSYLYLMLYYWTDMPSLACAL